MSSLVKLCVVVGFGVAAAGACAQEAAGEPWKIELHPGIWYAGLAGDVRLPADGGGSSAVATKTLNLDSPRVTPYGEVNLTKGNWLIEARGFGFSADANSEPTSGGPLGDIDISGGARVSTSVDLTGVELEGGYRVVAFERGKTEDGGTKVRFDVRVLGGVRLLDTSTSVSLPDGGSGVLRDSAEELAVHPLVGVKAKADLYEDFSIHVEMSSGWIGSSSAFDIVVGGQWRPTPHVGVQIGYRALFFELSTGDNGNEYEWTEASLQGLYAGITLSF